MTGNKVWFDAASDLYEKEIAKPVLWLGDDRHYLKAREVFGEDVVRMLDFVHYQQNIKNISYSGENIGFFTSENYLRAKDRCLKMMDRLDLYGVFGRIDREVIFNKLSIWTLKKLEESQPDALVVAEMPHSHAQYLLYEICLYLDLEIAKFNTWAIVPLLFLQDVKTGNRQKRNITIQSDLSDDLDNDIRNHIKVIIDRENQKTYELPYMKTQRLQLNIKNKIINFFRSDFLALIKEIWFQMRKYFSHDYYHINPFKIGIFGRSRIKRLRKINLLKELKKNKENINLNKKFVYYALHFEPERTTNPDGGIFHDQGIAIVALRKLLPNDIDIFVKEHPSQFYMGDRGCRGRSPLFYDYIKNINGVSFVAPEEDSLKLIKKSIFVATIGGSVALESAIMEKHSLIFGDTWFNGCPNVTSWNDNLILEDILEKQIVSSDKVLDFLLLEKELHGVPGCQNISAQKRFPHYQNEIFEISERKGVAHLMEEFFKNIENKNHAA